LQLSEFQVLEGHYYPFGLVMSRISSKAAGSLENKQEKFNCSELNTDFDLNTYEFQFRTYDPQIGPWHGLDTKPTDMVSLYTAMANNPPRLNGYKMKKIVLGLALFSFSLVGVCQSIGHKTFNQIKVLSIEKYDSSYLIVGIDQTQSDTVRIISEIKNSKEKRIDCKKLTIGNIYNFLLADMIGNTMPVGGDFIVADKGKKVIWRKGDPLDKIPLFSRNTDGLCFLESNF
jgi:RHS repeat-associated protein